RILCRTPEYTELEVVLYPFSTAAEALAADPRWRETARGMAEWTRPGPTSNWDEAMRAALVAELRAEGTDPDALDDRELVERTAPWCLDRTEFTDSFTTFFSQWDGTRMRVHPELEEWLLAQNQGRSVEEEWQRELYARGMFENRVRGSCTSSAIYLNGCLRALGIPARIVYTIPIVDASDEREMQMVRRLRHPAVRGTILRALEPLRESWSSHTFNEVFVGGRWRRLNYQHLGQGILDANLFGLIMHVATFSDWADADVASSIGLRQRAGKDAPDGFGGPNPYSTVSLSDQFGVHCGIDPEALPELPEVTTLTVERVGWYLAADRDPSVSMTLDDAREAGHVLVQVEEFLPGEDSRQYAEAY
ncbi:MAG: transglutaminase domain-containing protein, partial [Myxococcaceae bacterium]|nr:transglutaminase domain-containing protein [Myxococcaceae bacterium]